jgi:hypothetical protein
MFVQTLIDGIHPLPQVDYEFEIVILSKSITYRVQTFIYAFQFLKLYHIIELLGIYTRYTDSHSQRFG